MNQEVIVTLIDKGYVIHRRTVYNGNTKIGMLSDFTVESAKALPSVG